MPEGAPEQAGWSRLGLTVNHHLKVVASKN